MASTADAWHRAVKNYLEKTMMLSMIFSQGGIRLNNLTAAQLTDSSFIICMFIVRALHLWMQWRRSAVCSSVTCSVSWATLADPPAVSSVNVPTHARYLLPRDVMHPWY